MEELAYIAKPGGKRAHLERPKESWGRGGPWAVLVRAARRVTYCGLPIDGAFEPAPDTLDRCATCVSAEFVDGDDE